MDKGIVTYGSRRICFDILYVPRKTLEIAVMPDTRVIIRAPLSASYDEIHKRVSKRARWIIRQIHYFRQFEPRTPPRQYLSGEDHLYLGKRYRLKILAGSSDSVKLRQGYFIITSARHNHPEHIKDLLDTWYTEKARSKLLERFEGCWENTGKHFSLKPEISIKRMKTRWGSLSKNGVLTLNTRLICAPQECIDYVITHELCHLSHHDHGNAFFQLLENVMPDWITRKHKLELMLA